MMLPVLILLSLGMVWATNVNSPQVNVYSYKPITRGESNILLCHAKEFNPPNIKLTLLKDGAEMANANQSDLSFESNWRFKLTKYVEFVPKDGVAFSCRVEHNGGTTRDYYLEY